MPTRHLYPKILHFTQKLVCFLGRNHVFSQKAFFGGLCKALSWKKFFEKCESNDVTDDKVEDVFSTVNSSLKQSLKSGTPENNFSCQALARLLLFFALSISDDDREKGKNKGQSNKASWLGVKRRLETFVSEVPKGRVSKQLCQTYTDDKIAQLATMSTRTRGTADQNFYTTLLLFLMYEAEKGLFENDFLRRMVSKEDQRIPSLAATVLIDRLTHSSQSHFEEKTRPVRPLFVVRDSQHARLDTYFQRHSIYRADADRKRQMQCVIYRPKRTNPKELMKTFLSVYQQDGTPEEPGGFSYTHIYQPPEAGQQNRFSGGKVIPLDDAVYMMGGQRPLEKRRRILPFDSVKVIAFRWFDIDRNHPLFPALVMTTNYKGEIMVSRAAVRLTPLSHSNEVPLKAVSVDSLEDNLKADKKLEEEYIAALSDHSDQDKDLIRLAHPLTLQKADTKALSEKILMMCNNDPHTKSGLAAPDGFSRKEGRKMIKLNTHALDYALSTALGDLEGNPYINEDGEAFDLWLHTRFGPLALD